MTEIQIEIQRRRPFMLAVAYRIVKNWGVVIRAKIFD